MIGRKTSPGFLVLLALGFFFASYNLLTMSVRYKASKGSELFDPVVRAPGGTDRAGKGIQKFHVAVTATASTYSQWQCRIMYYWYKKVKDMPGSDMGGFTRVLHSGLPDNLMKNIPTFIVDPLPEGLDRVRNIVFFCLLDLMSCSVLVFLCLADLNELNFNEKFRAMLF